MAVSLSALRTGSALLPKEHELDIIPNGGSFTKKIVFQLDNNFALSYGTQRIMIVFSGPYPVTVLG
jgi:hypothetical protein